MVSIIVHFTEDINIEVKSDKKILLCSLSMTLGGVEIRMGHEARVLQKQGFDVRIGVNMHGSLKEWSDNLKKDDIVVYDYDPPPVMEQWLWNKNNKYFKKGWFAKYNYTLWRIFRIRNKTQSIRYTKDFFKQFKPDLVHVFVPWTNFEGTRIWLAHYFSIPIVISVRNAFDFTNWLPWHVRHYQEAFRSVRGIYAISESAMQNFIDIYGKFIRPETHIEVIYNSVDTQKFSTSSNKKRLARIMLNVPENALVMGFVGRLDKQKRPFELIKIFKNVCEEVPELHLVIVGSGPLEGKLKKFAENLHLSNRIIFSGWKSDVENFIPAFDIAVTISRNEGFGTTTIEAMACGIPVVGTNIPGTRDILQNTNGGVLVPLGDRNAAVHACITLLSNSTQRKRMGISAKQEALKRFSDEIWERKIVKFYEKIFCNRF